MKRGLLIYNFDDIEISHINIGDYIQTLAALQIVNEDWRNTNLKWINREKLYNGSIDNKNDEQIKFIANGWYTHNQSTFPIEKNLLPLFTSIHINYRLKLTNEVIETFKKFEPIGCRDLNSLKKLKEVGIKSYFSGCLTLTMEKRETKRKGLIFVVDNINGTLSYNEFKKWPGFKIVKKILLNQFSKNEIKNAKFLSQESDKNLSIEKQFELAEKWLDTLSSAELVVTTRIHSLMPSMAVGTPSLFLMLNNKDDRFGGLIDFWNYLDFTNYFKTKKINNYRISYTNGKISNNEIFRTVMKKEKEKIKKWWKEMI